MKLQYPFLASGRSIATVMAALLTVVLTVFALAISHSDDSNASSSVPEPLYLDTDQLPLALPDSLIVPLRTLLDADLQQGLEEMVRVNRKWTNLVAQKRMAIAVVDLTNPLDVRFARINGNNEMYAASLPKIAILLATMDALEKGEIEETEQLQSDMRLMIARSDNAASTRLIDLLGYDKISSVLRDPRYELYDEEWGGGLWVGKRYASTGPRRGDPLKNISHAATASQVARYYYLLSFGKLVSFDRSREMLEILSDPELHHKFVNTLDDIAPNAEVFRKSGSWRTHHSDSAIVWGNPSRRYILVSLIDDSDGEQILRNLIEKVDGLIVTE